MILDSYKLHSLVVQINYPSAFELWDHAGEVARRLSRIWGELKVSEGVPNQQTLSGKDIAISTAFNQSIINVHRKKLSGQQYIAQIKQSYDVWRESLSLEVIERVSARSIYIRDFDSIKKANAAILDLKLAKWPSEKIFNQSPDSDLSGLDISYRFQDDKSFSILRLRTEQQNFHAEFDEELAEHPIDVNKHRSIIDFDRATLGKIDASKFRMEDWMDGYTHVLRRDIGKVIGDHK